MRRVIALGYFDGVHLGHGALLRLARERAAQLDAVPSMLSFDCHPSTLLADAPEPMLTGVDDRRGLAARLYGVTDCIVLHFDRARMCQPWQAFLQEMRDTFGAVWFVVGEDFRCGWRGEGTPARLRAWGEERGCGVDVVPQLRLDGEPVSSTRIRALVAAGRMEEAARLLGHRHGMTAEVCHGRRLGHEIGVPTLNQRVAPGLLAPKPGSYFALAVTPDGIERPAITSVSTRPTVSENDAVTVESHLLEGCGELYGVPVRVEFCRYDAPIVRFDSIAALKARIDRSVAAAREYFGVSGGKET